MSAGTPALADQEVERLYTQARRYDLLTLEQERDIDGKKWAAIHSLINILLEDPHSRHYLARWAARCTGPLPEIEAFGNRKNRGLLRRELTEYLPGGGMAHKAVALHQAFRDSLSTAVLFERLLDMALPSSLVVGIAEVLMRGDDGEVVGGKVAAALVDWERLWPPEACEEQELAANTRTSLASEIRRYNAARDLLIVHNLRLVFTIAGRNRNKGASFLDLVQEGNLGLLRAAEKFQFTKGYRFSTYAFNWITQAIKRHLADAAGSIRLPTHVQEQLGRVYGEHRNILSRKGAAPLDTELADALGLPVADTRELLQLRNFAVSFDTPSFDEEGATLLDSTSGGPFPDPGDEAEQSSLHRQIMEQIKRLDGAEQRVVIQRWGLHDGPPLSRAEIADQMSVSTEWVRLLERSALQKLRQSRVMSAVNEDHLQT